MSDIKSLLLVVVAFLPFILFVWLDTKSNLKKEIRNKQFFMPFAALIYCVVLFVLLNKLGNLCVDLVHALPDLLHKAEALLAGKPILENLGALLAKLAGWIETIIRKVNFVYIILVVFNTLALICFLILKKTTLLFFKSRKRNSSLTNSVVGIFYEYDEKTGLWYIRPFFGQARAFLKIAFYVTAIVSGAIMLVSCYLCGRGLIIVPFYPVFAIIMIGELAFFIDGAGREGENNTLSTETDRSNRITNYVILRKKLKELFADKLSSDGTTVNDAVARGGSIDQIFEEIERECGQDGHNYSLFIKRKIQDGLIPNADYVRSGIDLTMGKSLLFNTPFYYKLTPYVFYAMQKNLLKGGKALVVLGRHGTEEDAQKWISSGLFEVAKLPNMWKVGILGNDSESSEELDVGIITRSGVHDLELHKLNRAFLRDVSFAVIVEPSRLVTTAQIGLNLLVKNISPSVETVYCSVDRNCDGLVDSLSHILMTNITEVSATEFPQGTNSYMCWLADSDYLQHRMMPGISRFLGMGTEFSFVALKNQVEKTIWYGGEAFPVLDEHWIAKQYYHDLLAYTDLPATQETFDKYFKVSYNLCNEQVQENSYISVEDEFNNLFEIKRELSTMSLNQGFVNVISTEYMLREYMTDNEEIFCADPKAIPYVSADYARTKRNVILNICLRMSLNGILKEDLKRELMLIGISVSESDMRQIVWKELCLIFGNQPENVGNAYEIAVDTPFGKKVFVDKTIVFKHEYSVESGKFEDYYVINDEVFKKTVIDDLQNAKYIAEAHNESSYLGSELKGHILQKYLPGQFFTLNGKYYEMVSLTSDNQVLLRRASEHITGRLTYRQIRRYKLDSAHDAETMGMLKSVRGIRLYNQFADFSVSTPAYWRLGSCNDFAGGAKVEINNVPDRIYRNKQILKLDFSDFGDAFTDDIRTTLTTMMNEVFSTLFAENAPYIVAVTGGEYEKPLTMSLEGDAVADKCIYIIEDSQLDIGLLVAVERNVERILQIIADYLEWNREKIEFSLNPPVEPVRSDSDTSDENGDSAEEADKKKPCFIKRLLSKIGGLFKRKGKKDKPKKDKQNRENDTDADITKDEETSENGTEPDEKPHDSLEETETAEENWDEEQDNVADSELVDVEVIEASDEAASESEPKKKTGLFGRLFGRKNKKDKPKKGKKKNNDAEDEVAETVNVDDGHEIDEETETSGTPDAEESVPDIGDVVEEDEKTETDELNGEEEQHDESVL